MEEKTSVAISGSTPVKDRRELLVEWKLQKSLLKPPSSFNNTSSSSSSNNTTATSNNSATGSTTSTSLPTPSPPPSRIPIFFRGGASPSHTTPRKLVYNEKQRVLQFKKESVVSPTLQKLMKEKEKEVMERLQKEMEQKEKEEEEKKRQKRRQELEQRRLFLLEQRKKEEEEFIKQTNFIAKEEPEEEKEEEEEEEEEEPASSVTRSLENELLATDLLSTASIEGSEMPEQDVEEEEEEEQLEQQEEEEEEEKPTPPSTTSLPELPTQPPSEPTPHPVSVTAPVPTPIKPVQLPQSAAEEEEEAVPSHINSTKILEDENEPMEEVATEEKLARDLYMEKEEVSHGETVRTLVFSMSVAFVSVLLAFCQMFPEEPASLFIKSYLRSVRSFVETSWLLSQQILDHLYTFVQKTVATVSAAPTTVSTTSTQTINGTEVFQKMTLAYVSLANEMPQLLANTVPATLSFVVQKASVFSDKVTTRLVTLAKLSHQLTFWSPTQVTSQQKMLIEDARERIFKSIESDRTLMKQKFQHLVQQKQQEALKRVDSISRKREEASKQVNLLIKKTKEDILKEISFTTQQAKKEVEEFIVQVLEEMKKTSQQEQLEITLKMAKLQKQLQEQNYLLKKTAQTIEQEKKILQKQQEHQAPEDNQKVLLVDQVDELVVLPVKQKIKEMEELVVPVVDQVKSKYVAPVVENVVPMMENMKEQLLAKEKQLENAIRSQSNSQNTPSPLVVIGLFLIVIMITLFNRWQRRRRSRHGRMNRTERWKKFVREHTHEQEAEQPEQEKEEEEDDDEIVFVPAATTSSKNLALIQAETESSSSSSKSEPEAEKMSITNSTTSTIVSSIGTPMIVRRSRRLSEKTPTKL